MMQCGSSHCHWQSHHWQEPANVLRRILLLLISLTIVVVVCCYALHQLPFLLLVVRQNVTTSDAAALASSSSHEPEYAGSNTISSSIPSRKDPIQSVSVEPSRHY